MSIHASILFLVLGSVAAHAGVREEVANKKYICSSSPDLEEWLWFGLDGNQVFRYAGNAEFIDLKWSGDRVVIWGKEDQDGPFYFEKKGGRYEYSNMPCREVKELPIKNIPKNRILR